MQRASIWCGNMNTFFTVLAALFVYESIFVLIRLGIGIYGAISITKKGE